MSKQDDETKETLAEGGELTLARVRKAVATARHLATVYRRQLLATDDARQLALAVTHLEEAELHLIVAQRGGLERL